MTASTRTPPRAPPHRRAGVAQRLAAALRPFVGGDLPVRLTAWDGSTAGPEDAPHVELRSPDALRRMGVDQVLCVRPGAAHTLPPVRA